MYKRIYNKKLLSKNGTLVDNWFEEEELRKRTGVSRSIPLQNFPRKFCDFENPIKNPNPGDDTFKRIINNEHTGFYKTTYSNYGDFSFPEKRYKYEGDEEKEFNEFISNKMEDRRQKNNFKEPISLFDATVKNTMVPQDIEGPFGQRLMKTQDLENIPEERKDHIFQNEMGINNANPGVISKNDFKQAFNNYKIPYYKDKPLTYWAMNQNRANVYHSASNGLNSFARSSGFTQPIQNTRGVYMYNQNITNNKRSEEIFLDKKDEEFIDEYYNYERNKNEKEENSIEKCYEKGNMEVCQRYLNEIKYKIVQDIRKKGWTGLRQLKLYLKSVVNNGIYRQNNFIEKTEFKFHIYRWGITSLTDNEIDLIYKMFGKNCNNTIDYIEFLNDLHINSQRREDMIVKTMNIFRQSLNDKYIHFSGICNYMNMNYHPEVLKLEKDKNKAEKEFIQSWGYLKEDDLITLDNFSEYFEDISTCLNDEDFEQCLYAVSYYYFQK